MLSMIIAVLSLAVAVSRNDWFMAGVMVLVGATWQSRMEPQK